MYIRKTVGRYTERPIPPRTLTANSIARFLFAKAFSIVQPLTAFIMSGEFRKASFDMDKQKDVEFVEESHSHDADREKEEKALVRKIDLYLLPTMWLMYLLSYMDVSIHTVNPV